jgi:formylglycine-generating enzyme required for sulfatase activity
MDSSQTALIIFISLLLGIGTLFILDKPPVVEKIKGPSQEITSIISIFEWNGNDPDGNYLNYEYRKDGGRWKRFYEGTKYVWAGYSEGEHTFDVRARDINGKSSEIVSWTFNYQPNPLKSIDIDFPSGKIDISSVTFEWHSEIPVENVQVFEFKKDDNDWTNCGTLTNFTWSDYSIGKHTFKVRAKTEDEEYIDVKNWTFEYTQEPISGEMVKVEAGTYTMGDNFGDGSANEIPAHEVTLTNDFYIGKYEVTFKEYTQFCSETGQKIPHENTWGSEEVPILNLSWWEAASYCNWLSVKKGFPVAYDENGNLLDKNGNITTDISKVVGYRLPTEAEWEFAARGANKSKGYKYAGSNNPDEIAWYSKNSKGSPSKVGMKKPNELGLYDMSGNVNEWCQDWYISDYSKINSNVNPYTSEIVSGSFRVVRGGNWSNPEMHIRVSSRDAYSPEYKNITFGVRICRTAE